MKSVSPRLASLLASALALGGLSTASAEHATRAPVVIQRPLINDGSIASRTPFLAERPFNDAKRADGQAIDPDIPPNTPATDIPKPPPPVAAIGRRSREPVLTPTGPTTLAASADVLRISPGIRAMSYESRDAMLTELSARIDGTIQTMNADRDIQRDMAAATRDQFKDAIAQVELQERALRRSIKEARKADPAQWESIRTELASNYDTFAAAAQTFDNVFASFRPNG